MKRNAMKKCLLMTLVIGLLLGTVASTALAELEGTYTWNDRKVEITSVFDKSMFTPTDMKDDEYAMMIRFMVDEEVWKDDTIRYAFYSEAGLTDTNGNVYYPGVCMTGQDDPSLIFVYALPKTVSVDTLSLNLEGNTGETADAESDGTLEFYTADGKAFKLTALENGAFLTQDPGIIVSTRVGSTVFNGGSQAKAGSALSLKNMKNTKQYEMPMVSFKVESELEKDEVADFIGKLAAGVTLRMDGETYRPQVAWITRDMAAYIFDCPELPEGVPAFYVDGTTVVIEPVRP